MTMAAPMAKMSALMGLFVGLAMVGLVSSAKFEELFQPAWANDHFIREGELLKLKLDKYSGTFFIHVYIYGS